jgi:ABC-type phosphate/phosphonate transport system substrate-binding protein
MTDALILGAVAYAPKVVTIWEGFKEYFVARGLPFDYILYSNYERQVEAQFSGQVHVAWNSPLAWLRAELIAGHRGLSDQVQAIAMRDTDCDLTSVIVVRADAGIRSLADLRGKRLGVGAIDSPQATLIPLQWLREQGLDPDTDLSVLRHDVLGGKHGDHVGGERDAARALIDGTIDAACMIDGNHLLFINEGTLPAGRSTVLARTPAFDHCNFTTSPGAPAALIERFGKLVMDMSFDDPQVRPLLELEGLRQWRPGRISGYDWLARSVKATGFYDARGDIGVADYRY